MKTSLESSPETEQTPRSLVSASGVLALAMLVASGANYLLNLILARLLGPAQFGDASLMVTTMLALTSLAVGVQLYTVKVTTARPSDEVAAVGRKLRSRCVSLGVVVGVALAAASPWLSDVLRTQSALPFVVLAIGMPAFLGLSVDRGLLQGEFRFGRLATSYLTEAFVRIAATIALVAFGAGATGASWGLTISFVAAWATARTARTQSSATPAAMNRQRSSGLGPLSVLLVAQVVINNGDVILSKQLFDPEMAGAYAAVALVGRAVFFASWAVVQAAFPAAVASDEHDSSVASAATLMVAVFGAVSVVAMFVTAPFISSILFGDSFADIASLLGPYALATALFAVANVMATVDVAQQRSSTAWLLFGGAVAQTVGIAVFASTVQSIVWIQTVVMAVLLVVVGSTRLIRWYNGLKFSLTALPRVAPSAAV